MPTTIIYKGATIAELQAGSIGTLSCNGKEMESDIVVVAPDSEGGGTSADERVKYVTFMNGATELISYPVIVGDTVKNPATAGLIDTPTKEPTTSTVYTFSGWSLTEGGAASSSALANVTEDRIVYAAFTESARLYTVNFYDGDTLVYTQQVSYGGSSSYTYTKDDYIFIGWQPEPKNVTADMDCYAQWEEGIDFAQASWAKIAEISESGNASKFFAIGDRKTMVVDGQAMAAEIIAFNHDDLADGTGKAGITLLFNHTKTAAYLTPKSLNNISFNASATKTGGWVSSDIRNSLRTTIMGQLPADLQSVIKTVTKDYNVVKTVNQCEDTLWIPSNEEVGASLKLINGVPNADYPITPVLGTHYPAITDAAFGLEKIRYWTRNTSTVSGSGNVYKIYKSMANDIAGSGQTDPNTPVANTGWTPQIIQVVGFCI